MSINNLPVPHDDPNDPFPPVATDNVLLYPDQNWRKWTPLSIWNETHNVLLAVPDEIKNRASYVAFNLPPGRVVTLCEEFVEWDPSKRDHLGRTVDLIGNGKPQYCDLNVFIRDCIKAYYIRDVAIDRGYFVLYEGDHRDKNRTTVFLDEWEESEIVDMNRWYMNNKASSLDWELPYGDRVELYEHLDGTGRSLAVGETVLSRLEDPLDGVRNQISSFKWKDLPPEREELGTAVISLTNRRFKQDTVTRYDLSGTDPLPKGIVVDGGTVTVDLTIEEATNVAVETTKEFFYTATTSISVEIFAATIEVSFEVGATDTKTRTIENSHNDTLGFGREYTVPPGSEWHLVGTVQKGTLDYGATIPVTRWYKLKVPNSEYDAGLWRLKLSVPVLITGTKSSNLHFDLFRCGIDGNTVKDEGRPLIKRG